MLFNFCSLKTQYNLKIHGVIHVGGHWGEEIASYIANGIEQIAIFEPLPENVTRLKAEAGKYQKNISVYETALGAITGQHLMHVSSNNALSSSLLLPKKHLSQYPDVVFNSQTIVNISTLDSFQLNGFNFLNMDVQGYELEVLKGSENTLKGIDYIYTEVNRDELYENNAFIEEIDNFLDNYTRVATDWSGNTWGDALYIKKGLS